MDELTFGGSDADIEISPTQAEMAAFEVTPQMWDKALQYYREHLNDLATAANFYRQDGISHRNPPFLVGAAILAIEPRLQVGEYGVYTAFNIKPYPGEVHGWDKNCAERNAARAALSGWAKVIVAIVTVSKEVNTGDSTHAHDALHPCLDCRQMYRELLGEGLIRLDSRICCAHTSDKAEEMSLGELLDKYKDDPIPDATSRAN